MHQTAAGWQHAAPGFQVAGEDAAAARADRMYVPEGMRGTGAGQQHIQQPRPDFQGGDAVAGEHRERLPRGT